MGELSHVDGEGRACMVDVGDKPIVRRRAVATGRIDLAPQTLARIRANEMKKGDVLTVAQIAGIQAAKRCPEWIPLCHPLPLTKVDVRFVMDDHGVAATGEAACTGRTGVEMEALTAVSAALLTVYDMCKAVDKAMVIRDIRLLEKTKEEA
ncbi:MAG: cyclic pyranopterin monophosphate synthase MoaC [Pseudomonadota bacterium]